MQLFMKYVQATIPGVVYRKLVVAGMNKGGIGYFMRKMQIDGRMISLLEEKKIVKWLKKSY